MPSHLQVGFATLGCLVLACGCTRQERTSGSGAPPGADTERVSVVVSIPPEAYFVEQVAGDLADIEVLVEPGQSHATFEPTPKQMAILEGADVYFRIGVPFENSLLHKIEVAAPNLQVVDLREGIELRKMASHAESDHEHGDADPHIWLDPILVKTQAATIERALCAFLPADAGVLADSTRLFCSQLDALDDEIAAQLKPYAGRSVLVYHPAYGYFMDRYGLTQTPIELEGKEPSGRELSEIVAIAKETHATTVFVQPGFATATAEAVAHEIGGRIETLPLQPRDYPAALREIADLLASELSHAD